MDSLTFVRQTLAPLAGKRVLDIGCGGGLLSKALAADGADVAGLDPQERAVIAARNALPAGDFRVGVAEALPFADSAFHAAVFLNSLHHVPETSMLAALAEARRVVANDGLVIVIEPLAKGTFNAVLRIIDDEEYIRALAQQAIRDASAWTDFRHETTLTYTRPETFADLDAFIVRTGAVDPARQAVAQARRPDIAEAFSRFAARDGERFRLDQPLKADVFRKV